MTLSNDLIARIAVKARLQGTRKKLISHGIRALHG
jgi:hypothetical protein